MKNKDIDLYLGDWQPSVEADCKPFLYDKSIGVFGPNLTGAKHTFALPKYAADTGVKDFADLQTFTANSAMRFLASSPATTAPA